MNKKKLFFAITMFVHRLSTQGQILLKRIEVVYCKQARVPSMVNVKKGH